MALAVLGPPQTKALIGGVMSSLAERKRKAERTFRVSRPIALLFWLAALGVVIWQTVVHDPNDGEIAGIVVVTIVLSFFYWLLYILYENSVEDDLGLSSVFMGDDEGGMG